MGGRCRQPGGRRRRLPGARGGRDGCGADRRDPAHDVRDHAFATKYDLPIVETIQADAGFDVRAAAWTGDGVVVNSANDEVSLDGLDKELSKARITQWLEDRGLGHGAVTYRLRDWLFSRPRDWGEPSPGGSAPAAAARR